MDYFGLSTAAPWPLHIPNTSAMVPGPIIARPESPVNRQSNEYAPAPYCGCTFLLARHRVATLRAREEGAIRQEEGSL